MAHPQQISFIEVLSKNIAHSFAGLHILEMGSYDVNGGIRKFFPDSNYCGVDLIDGPGVDIVADGHLVSHDDNFYDVTLSCECFEHNPFWLETFFNMLRMTKKGGVVAFTCATKGRREHGTRRTAAKDSPGTQSVGWDYYRNLTAKDFTKNIEFKKYFSSFLFLINKKSRDLYFVGQMIGSNKAIRFDQDLFVSDYVIAQEKLELELEEKNKILKNQLGHKKKFFYAVSNFIYAPQKILIYLPDKYYQDSTIFYEKFIAILTKPFKIIIKKFL
ncbi:hypothetical protein ICN17_01215 [Polynucleobacter sp. 73C-SIWE]|uniref:class I SAM-dependent methyltransferase n=1 Tax=Polynucleobacter sp. 73C-SIWE TaxID=2689098 RepID=UPI001C0C93BD|nr:class I SAM-dependent methyltransferase [Polynucleobacter sp. 73C-SIWE]MBU3578621.1 hypothetical protein [Polynucleobacter sp. 73C-SIWE]